MVSRGIPELDAAVCWSICMDKEARRAMDGFGCLSAWPGEARGDLDCIVQSCMISIPADEQSVLLSFLEPSCAGWVISTQYRMDS